jgi:hypothetical protein
MGLETATYIKDLVPANPTITDFVGQGDDHLRMIKSVLQNTFPAQCGPTLPTVGGTANAITLTYSTAPGSNLAGEVIYFTPTAANTGATTISVNGNTALPLQYQGAALVGGELQTGRVYQAIIGAGATTFHLVANAALPLTGGTLTGPLTPSQTAGLVGTTAANDANAGAVGEYITAAQTTAQPITNGVAGNIVSFTLTAGDWDVEGWGGIALSAGGEGMIAAISTASATLPLNLANGGYAQIYHTGQTFYQAVLPTGSRRISIGASTTIYLVLYALFTAGTASVTGALRARRVR